MIDTELIEGNKLIAEFMGIEVPHEQTTFAGNKIINYVKISSLGDEDFLKVKLYYRASWDKLMPVIEKIGSLPLTVGDNPLQITISMFYEGDIVEVWKHIVYFIKWYNNR